jgi:hypothetical protein
MRDDWKRFGLVCVGAFVLMLGTIVGFTMLVDPYSLTNAQARKGWNTNLPQLIFQTRTNKALGLRRESYDTILLGSSIVDNAFRLAGSSPYHGQRPTRALPDTARGVYNAGIRGGGTFDALRYLRHARRQNPDLKRAILVLEWTLFTTASVAAPRTADDPFLADNPLWRLGYLKYASWSSLDDAVKTVQANRGIANPQGLNAPLADFWRAFVTPAAAGPALGLRLHLPHPVVARTTPETRALYFSLYFGEALRDYVVEGGQGALAHPTALGELRELVAFARANGIELSVYISPQHPLFWAMMQRLDLWPAHLQWLREIARITPFHDLSAIADFAPGSDAAWDSDPLHFQPVLGERLLPLMLDRAVEVVTEQTVEAAIARRTRLLQDWLQANRYVAELLAQIHLPKHRIYYPAILPSVVDNPAPGLRTIRVIGRHYALPASEEPFDLLRLLRGDYVPTITGNSPQAVADEIRRRGITVQPLIRLPTAGVHLASATHPATKPENAFDGNPASLWISDAAGAEIRQAYFGHSFTAPVTLRRIVLNQIPNSHFHQDDVMVQSSLDGTHWRDALPGPTHLFGRTQGIINLPNAPPAPHWRVIPADRATETRKAWVIADIEFYTLSAAPARAASSD